MNFLDARGAIRSVSQTFAGDDGRTEEV